MLISIWESKMEIPDEGGVIIMKCENCGTEKLLGSSIRYVAGNMQSESRESTFGGTRVTSKYSNFVETSVFFCTDCIEKERKHVRLIAVMWAVVLVPLALGMFVVFIPIGIVLALVTVGFLASAFSRQEDKIGNLFPMQLMHSLAKTGRAYYWTLSEFNSKNSRPTAIIPPLYCPHCYKYHRRLTLYNQFISVTCPVCKKVVCVKGEGIHTCCRCDNVFKYGQIEGEIVICPSCQKRVAIPGEGMHTCCHCDNDFKFGQVEGEIAICPSCKKRVAIPGEGKFDCPKCRYQFTFGKK
jgi:hypothetical protein